MSKKEMLARAKRDYPVGCTFISPHNNKVYIRYASSYEYNGIYDGIDNSVLCIINEEGSVGEYLFIDGQWAKIISYPDGYNIKSNYYFY